MIKMPLTSSPINLGNDLAYPRISNTDNCLLLSMLSFGFLFHAVYVVFS